LGAKGGRRKLTPAQHADLIDRMNYSSKYEGPEPGIPELTHDASAKIDAANPRLRDAFKLTEEEKIARAVQQASGRAGGLARAANREASVRAPRDIAAMRVRGSNPGAMMWAINPKTGGIRLSQYIPDKLNDTPYLAGDLFATHADWFEKIGFPVAGGEFDKIPRGYARIEKGGFQGKGVLRIIDNGMEEDQEGLTSPPLTDAQYRALTERIGKRFKLPGYQEGGTVANTGIAMVHQGEAVVPQADTLKRSIDALTFEMHSNTGVMGWFVNSMVSPMLGGRAPSLPVPIPGIGTVTIPSLFGGGSGGGGGAAASGASGGYSPVGGYSPAGGGRGGVQIPLGLGSAAGGGSRIPGSGFSPHAMLASIKGTDWGGFTRPTVHEFDEQGFATGETHKGGITGMHGVAGAAAFAGGTMLAQRGLMGQDMGTWGGVAEGAAGGAAIGFTYGGPLGAAIGAGVGFGIGVGEKIAGVKSPAREAHDDIKQVYGVDIPPNSGTVKQVVELARSQFGGSISVAVRSPSVRQLVMLYSEATGQKMPLSAATPYAGSLVEQGGSLYQQASFQNNSWNTYASNLPTLGGIVGGTFPTPGGAGAGGTTIALNINGQPITPEFVTDQSMAAQGASYGRTQQAANMQVPGLMVA
jgi:hypothetical protein